jgi:hypothetical protein
MAFDRSKPGRFLVVVVDVLRLDDLVFFGHDLEQHLPMPGNGSHVPFPVLERLLGGVHSGPGAYAVVVNEGEFKALEPRTGRFEPGQ